MGAAIFQWLGIATLVLIIIGAMWLLMLAVARTPPIGRAIVGALAFGGSITLASLEGTAVQYLSIPLWGIAAAFLVGALIPSR